MSENPSTIQGNPANPADAGWDDAASLHKSEGGGGVLHGFKTLRNGTLVELVRFVMSLPDDQQQNYAIEKEGDHVMQIGEIRELARRSDYPG